MIAWTEETVGILFINHSKHTVKRLPYMDGNTCYKPLGKKDSKKLKKYSTNAYSIKVFKILFGCKGGSPGPILSRS